MPDDTTPRLMTELGSSHHSGGTDLYNFSGARDPLRELHGEKGIKAFREMRYNEATLGAVTMGVEMVMRSLDWNPEPPESVEDPEDDEEAQRYVTFAKECMNDLTSMTWDDVISDALEATTYGWEFQEVTFKRRLGHDLLPDDEFTHPSEYDDGLIGWHSIAHRDQLSLKQWVYGPNGQVLGFLQYGEPGEDDIFIPIDKAVLWKTKHAGGDPNGYSWLRNAYRAWKYKKNLEWIEAVGNERRGVGLPVVQLPMGANVSEGSNDVTRAKELVERVRADAYSGVVLPPPLGEGEHQKWVFSLMSAEGSGPAGSSQHEIISRYGGEITVSVLAHFLNLGMQDRGAYALSRDERDLWQLALSGLVDQYRQIIDRQLLRPLFRLNQAAFPNRDLWPRMVPSDISQHDIEKLQTFIVAMIGAKAMNVSAEDRNRIRQFIGWPAETKEQRDQMDAEKAAADEMRDAAVESAKNPQPAAGAPGARPAGRDQRVAAAEEEVGKPLHEWDAADWLVFTMSGGDIG